MKTFKKIACSVLALGLVMGLTACKPKAFEYQKMVDFLEDQDMDDYDDYDDFIRDYSDAIGMGRDIDGIYIHCDGKDAQDVYDVVLNRFGDFPDYDVEESIAFAMHDEGGFGIGYLFTFEDEKEAEKLFKKYGKAFADDGENGEEKGYSYYIEAGTGTANKDLYSGVYLRGNTVIIIRTMGVDDEFVDDFCEVYGIISPTEA